MKKLRDLDVDSPFYSKEAMEAWNRHLKEAEREEKEMIEENRRRYKSKRKITEAEDAPDTIPQKAETVQD